MSCRFLFGLEMAAMVVLECPFYSGWEGTAVLEKQKNALIVQVIERARRMEIGFGSSLAMLVDVEIAVIRFDIQLEEWLLADDEVFAEEFCRIQKYVNRNTASFDPTFRPRFASAKS